MPRSKYEKTQSLFVSIQVQVALWPQLCCPCQDTQPPSTDFLPGPACFRGHSPVKALLLSQVGGLAWILLQKHRYPLSPITGETPETFAVEAVDTFGYEEVWIQQAPTTKCRLSSQQSMAGVFLIFKEPRSSRSFKPLPGEEIPRSSQMR